MICVPPSTSKAIEALQRYVHEGKISQEQIDASVKRILTYKFRLGLSKYQPKDVLTARKDVNSAQAEALKRELIKNALTMVRKRRKRYPKMHIYHYAPYEKSALLRLAGRYGVGEDDVDDLLRNGVLVDLYPLVRKSIRVGTENYSLKSLEPLYMGAELRTGEVLEALGLQHRSAVTVCGDTAERAKPFPDPLLLAARCLGQEPGACVYVGDYLRDVQAGRSAGMVTVAAAWGYLGAGEPIDAWGADHRVEDAVGLLKMLGLD